MTIQVPSVETNTITWAADSTPNMLLESSGAITRLECEVELVPSATLTGANQADGLNRVVRNLQLVGDGHKYFELPDDDGCQGGTILRTLNSIDGFGAGHGNGAITAPARTFTGIRFVLHAGTRPNAWGFDNPTDLSGFIPAGATKALRLTWSTAGNDVMDDTVTISSAVMRVGVTKIHAKPNVDAFADLLGAFAFQGLSQWQGRPTVDGKYQIMVPAWLGTVFAIPGTSTSHEAVNAYQDLTTNCYLRRFTVLAQDATGTRPVRAGDEITSIRMWEEGGARVFEKTAEMIQGALPVGLNTEADDGAADFQGNALQGIYPIDFRALADPIYGFNLMNAVKKWRIGYIHTTNASGDDRLSLEERYVPMALTREQLIEAIA